MRRIIFAVIIMLIAGPLAAEDKANNYQSLEVGSAVKPVPMEGTGCFRMFVSQPTRINTPIENKNNQGLNPEWKVQQQTVVTTENLELRFVFPKNEEEAETWIRSMQEDVDKRYGETDIKVETRQVFVEDTSSSYAAAKTVHSTSMLGVVAGGAVLLSGFWAFDSIGFNGVFVSMGVGFSTWVVAYAANEISLRRYNRIADANYENGVEQIKTILEEITAAPQDQFVTYYIAVSPRFANATRTAIARFTAAQNRP